MPFPENSKFNGFTKRRNIMKGLGIKDVDEYHRKIRGLYEKDEMSSHEIVEYLKKATGIDITARSIMRIVEAAGGKLRNPKESFNLAIRKGRVDWAYRSEKLKKRQMNKRLRLEILERDNFKCVYCGAEARDSVLEVDHIVAKIHGGGDEKENLQTLCNACNVGKRMKEEERNTSAMIGAGNGSEKL